MIGCLCSVFPRFWTAARRPPAACGLVCLFVERAVSFSFSLCLNFSAEFEWQEKLEFLVIWCCSCRRACKNLSAKFKHILIFVTSVFSVIRLIKFFPLPFFSAFLQQQSRPRGGEFSLNDWSSTRFTHAN